MTFEEEMVATAKELLEEFGVPVPITSSASGLDPNTLQTVPGVSKGTAHVAPFTPGRADSPETTINEEIARKRRWFYAYSEVDLQVGYTLVFATGKFLIESLKRIEAKTTTVYYELVTTRVT